jgi:hypothetical protein
MKLVLWSSGAVAADVVGPAMNRLNELASIAWDLAMEATTQAISNFEEPEVARTFAAMSRAISPSGREAYLRFERDSMSWDVTELLPAIRCPTLVLHPAKSPYVAVDNARGLAAGIRDAQLHLVDTASSLANHPDVLRVDEASSSSVATLSMRTGRLRTRSWCCCGHRQLDRPHGDVGRRGFGASARARRHAPLDHRARQQAHGRGQDPRRWRARDVPFGERRPRRSEALPGRRRSGIAVHLGLHAGDVIREGATCSAER